MLVTQTFVVELLLPDIRELSDRENYAIHTDFYNYAQSIFAAVLLSDEATRFSWKNGDSLRVGSFCILSIYVDGVIRNATSIRGLVGVGKQVYRCDSIFVRYLGFLEVL
jgi:hypothetical protein